MGKLEVRILALLLTASGGGTGTWSTVDACSAHGRMMQHQQHDLNSSAYHQLDSDALDELLYEQEFGHDNVPAFPCGMEEVSVDEKLELEGVYEEWKNVHRGRNLCLDYFEIPVYMTIFRSDSSSGYLDSSRIDQMMDTLQHGFRDTPFHFVLKRSRHVINSEYASCQGDFKDRYHVRRSDALSIYFCDLVGTRRVVGFTYTPVILNHYPREDGIIFMNPALGSNTPNNDITFYSNVLIHEVGHWMGLLHSWEDQCSNKREWQRNYGGVDYYFQKGDGVDDTPPHVGASLSYPGERTCWINPMTGLPTLNTCNGPDYDPVDNYMNYLSGRCYDRFGRFTYGQIQRMVAEYENFRMRGRPTCEPTIPQSAEPSSIPTASPTLLPTASPSSTPSARPTLRPSSQPSATPSQAPTSCLPIDATCSIDEACCGDLMCFKEQVVFWKKNKKKKMRMRMNRKRKFQLSSTGVCAECVGMYKKCTDNSHCCTKRCGQDGRCF